MSELRVADWTNYCGDFPDARPSPGAVVCPCLYKSGGGLPLKGERWGEASKQEEIGQKRLRVALLGAPLYEEPDEGSKKLAYLNKGTLMKVLEENGDFWGVRTEDGATGYVRISSAVAH